MLFMCLCVYMCMHMHEEALHLFFLTFILCIMSFLTEYINAHRVCLEPKASRRQLWELKRGSLEDQLVHITSEPSFTPNHFSHSDNILGLQECDSSVIFFPSLFCLKQPGKCSIP